VGRENEPVTLGRALVSSLAATAGLAAAAFSGSYAVAVLAALAAGSTALAAVVPAPSSGLP
jgi:hypothetical protein